MAQDLERLTVQLSADIKSYENAMKKAVGVTNARAREIEKRYQSMNASVNGAFGRATTAGVAALGGALSVREVARYADAWTAAKNSLAVAGVVGAEQVAILDQLYNSAQRNSTPIGALADLYGKAAMSAKELGASQSDLVKFADGIALSLRVSGKSAQEASGALQQLGQLLGSSRVQAEEFNSIVDGAPTIMIAAANGIEKAGGSVSKLKQLVNAGEISNREYFNGVLAGLPVIERMAANTEQSIGQAFVKINNAITRYIGQTDESLSASQRLVSGLNALADNFDQTADVALKVASVLAGALAGRAIGGMIAQIPVAASAVLTLAAALRTGALAGATLSAALGPIGLIAGAATAAIYLLSDATTDAEESALAHEAAMRVLEAEILNVDYASAGAVASTRSKIAADLDAAGAALARAAAERELAAAMASELINPSMSLLPAPAANDAANTIDNDPAVKDRQALIDTINKQIVDLKDAQSRFEAYARGDRPVPGPRGVAAPLPSNGGGSGGGGAGGRGAKPKQDELEKEIEQIQKRTAALQAETAAQAGINPLIDDYGYAVEKARAYQELETAAKEAGLPVTDALKTKMLELSDAYAQAVVASAQLGESQDEIRQHAEDMRDATRDASQGIVQDLLAGKSAADAFAGALGKVGDRLLNMAFDQAFGKGGLFGGLGSGGGFLNALSGLFGGFRAGGGPVQAGRAYVVGERRPELFVPGQSGHIVPSIPKAVMSPRGATGLDIGLAVDVDESGNLMPFVTRVSQREISANRPKAMRESTAAVGRLNRKTGRFLG